MGPNRILVFVFEQIMVIYKIPDQDPFVRTLGSSNGISPGIIPNQWDHPLGWDAGPHLHCGTTVPISRNLKTQRKHIYTKIIEYYWGTDLPGVALIG